MGIEVDDQNNSSALSAEEQQAVLNDQVRAWTKERDRLNDMIATAHGKNNSSAPELLPCPFCGGAARIESNRDWHKLRGDHDDDCVFVEPVILQVPATDDQFTALVADWNRRATQPPSDRVQGGLTDEQITEILFDVHADGGMAEDIDLIKFARAIERAILARQSNAEVAKDE